MNMEYHEFPQKMLMNIAGPIKILVNVKKLQYNISAPFEAIKYFAFCSTIQVSANLVLFLATHATGTV